MTRSECEERIKDLFDQIVDIYKEYNPNGKYLTASMVSGNSLSINNAYWEKGETYAKGDDYKIPLNIRWDHEK